MRRLIASSRRIFTYVIIVALALTAFAAISLLSVRIPQWQASIASIQDVKERVTLENEVFKTIVQILGGLLFLVVSSVMASAIWTLIAFFTPDRSVRSSVAPSSLAPKISAPSSSAPLSEAWRRSAPVRSVSRRSALRRYASSSTAPRRFAPRSKTFFIWARARLAPSRRTCSN